MPDVESVLPAQDADAPGRPPHNFALHHENHLFTALSNRPVEPHGDRSSDLYFPVAGGEQSSAADIGAPARNCASAQKKLAVELQRISRRRTALDGELRGAGGI